MLDDAAKLLRGPREEARHVLEGDDRDVEGIAEAHEARAFDRRRDVQRPRKNRGLVGYDSDRMAVETAEPDDDIPGKMFVHLEEVMLVDHNLDDFLHVVRLVGIHGDDGIEFLVFAIRRIRRGPYRRIFHVVAGQKRKELSNRRETFSVISYGKMSHAAGAVVGHGATQLVHGDLFVSHRPDNVGTCDEHVAGILDHQNEVRDRRRIDCAAGAGPHDCRDLRNHTAGKGVAEEDVGIPGEADHPFLDARAAGIIQPDDRSSHLHGKVHDLTDLLGIRFAEAPAKDGEILCEDIDEPAVDAPVTGDHAISGNSLVRHAEIHAAVFHELVQLFETPFVHEKVHPFPRRELRGVVLPLAAFRTSALLSAAVQFLQLLEFLGNIHRALLQGPTLYHAGLGKSAISRK